MLSLVLSDSKLMETYEYSPEDFEDIATALSSDNPVVVAVAKIIDGLNGSTDAGVVKKTYMEIFNYLNANLIR